MDPLGIESLDDVRAARAAIRQRDRETVAEQIHVARIPSPSGEEAARGAYVRDRFDALGLADVHVDAVGNVIARLPGPSVCDRADLAPVIAAAHLDTVFPAETQVEVRIENGRIHGPGITDNARGVAALLAIAAALRTVGLRTVHPVLFVGTVGEEGLGDLRGAKHLFRRDGAGSRASAFISIDGAGCSRIVTRAIGSRRLRFRVVGQGGHSWGDRGTPNPVDALGETIHGLNRLRPSDGEYVINVGRVGGGTSVNSIPAEAWLELDLRSGDEGKLEWLDREARRVLERSVRAASRGAPEGARLHHEIECVGDRPSGETPAETVLVRAAIAATEAIGAHPELTASSTDANVAISLGVPALAMGAGGRGGGIHTLGEWFENRNGALGIERALLTILAVAGVRSADQRDGSPVSTTE